LSTICAFIEVARAKQGHLGKVGINVMWKCSLTVLSSIYGAMLAGVDALLCGAGVPMELPDIVRRIRENRDLEYSPLHGTDTHVRLKLAGDESVSALARFPIPKLIPILSNFAFPKRIMDIWCREYDGARPFAFVLENHAAGGHNAPPRNRVSYGEADEVNNYFDKVRDLGIPVYVAGAGSTREDMLRWIERGAYGLQVGSRFALCRESGMRSDLRRQIIRRNARGDGEVGTSLTQSSTGYPFKYFRMPGTLSDQPVYEARKRVCNKGYLVHSHFTTRPDGSVHEAYICPAMPIEQYERLGGVAQDAQGRVCLCNCLLATAGLGDPGEPPLITLGENGTQTENDLSARDVVEDLLTPAFVAAMEQRLALAE
jgi:NAD(P)H-dependent flavin oxidoreductase YrpB (nitropropane dioxygenase family)